jgi:outer membrane protein assembly factor BamB
VWLLIAALLTPYLTVAPREQPPSFVPSVATPVTDDAQHGNWPMYRGSPARSGAMPGPGLSGPPAILWQFAAGAAANFAPAIADGVIYLPADDGTLSTLDATTGAVRWQTDATFAMPSASGGVLYYVSTDEDLVARDLATEQELWRATPGSRFWTPLVVDDTVYYGGEANLLVARDARTGEERWVSAQTTAASRSAALANGVLVVGSDDQNVYGIDQATGETTWQYTLGDGNGTIQTPAIADGAVYVGTFGGDQNAFVALDLQTGAERWRLEGTDGEGFHAAGVANGLVYVPSDAGTLRALDATSGEERWTYTATDIMKGAPTIVDGVVYAAGNDGIVLAFDATSGAEHWRLPLDGPIDFGPELVDGHLYVGTGFGNFYAIGSASELAPGATRSVPVITPSGGMQATPNAGTTGTPISPGSATPVPAASPVTAAAFPVVAASLELLWQSTGGPEPMSAAGAVALDAQGNVWVMDAGNDRFQIFSPDAQFLETWDGTGGGGQRFGFAKSNGGFDGDITFDGAGNVYVVESGSRRVQVFDGNRQLLASWGEFGTDDGQFVEPMGVAVDRGGNVYVLDHQRNDIQKFDGEGQLLATFAGSGEGDFRDAAYMAIDAQDTLWIAADNRVVALSSDGAFLREFGSTGDEPGMFDGSIDVAVDASGTVYVADLNNGRIQAFDATGQVLAVWDAGKLPSGGQNQPYALAPDNQGHLYVVGTAADGNAEGNVQKFRLPSEE